MQAEAIDDEPTTTQLVLMWYPRVAGLITLIGSLTMINMALKRRKFLFHRLVLGTKLTCGQELVMWWWLYFGK